MISAEQADVFARSWIAAWNSHDLQRILGHYTEDFEMTSPYIVQIAGEASGMLKGRAAVGAYWQKALERTPDLRFEPLHLLASINSVTLVYRSSRGNHLAAEVFFFNASGKVFKAAAHYENKPSGLR